MTLKQELDSFAANFAQRTPADIGQALQESIDGGTRSGIAERALKVGDRVPEFSLPNANGRQISLASLLAKGPIIINYYRGSWCPYCNLELRAYQAILSDIRAAGGDLVAISPQTAKQSIAAAEKNALTFEVLSDHGNRVASLFGIAYAIPEIVKAIGARFGTDLAAINGSDDGSCRFPLPTSSSATAALRSPASSLTSASASNRRKPCGSYKASLRARARAQPRWFRCTLEHRPRS
jgi:peroxiredoxin